ncbi:hypothetical protein [Candidatus Liberibacter africanus]|nr:hypothetical protein [Candidatus Liberibacter africanus]
MNIFLNKYGVQSQRQKLLYWQGQLIEAVDQIPPISRLTSF